MLALGANAQTVGATEHGLGLVGHGGVVQIDPPSSGKTLRALITVTAVSDPGHMGEELPFYL